MRIHKIKWCREVSSTAHWCVGMCFRRNHLFLKVCSEETAARKVPVSPQLFRTFFGHFTASPAITASPPRLRMLCQISPNPEQICLSLFSPNFHCLLPFSTRLHELPKQIFVLSRKTHPPAIRMGFQEAPVLVFIRLLMNWEEKTCWCVQHSAVSLQANSCICMSQPSKIVASV